MRTALFTQDSVYCIDLLSLPVLCFVTGECIILHQVSVKIHFILIHSVWYQATLKYLVLRTMLLRVQSLRAFFIVLLSKTDIFVNRTIYPINDSLDSFECYFFIWVMYGTKVNNSKRGIGAVHFSAPTTFPSRPHRKISLYSQHNTRLSEDLSFFVCLRPTTSFCILPLINALHMLITMCAR